MRRRAREEASSATSWQTRGSPVGSAVPTLDDVRAWLDVAAGEAETGVRAGHGGPFGAVVVRDGEVLATAHNRVLVDLDPTAHAEVMAIRAACRRVGSFSLAGAILVSSCEPCPMCLAASHWARVDGVWFGATRLDAAAAGFDDALLHAESGGPLDARSTPAVHVPHDRSAEPFRVWLAKADRVPF